MDIEKYQNFLSFYLENDYYEDFCNFIQKDINHNFNDLMFHAMDKGRKYVEKIMECNINIDNKIIEDCLLRYPKYIDIFFDYITQENINNINMDSNEKVELLKHNLPINTKSIDLRYLSEDNLIYLLENYRDIYINDNYFSSIKVLLLRYNHAIDISSINLHHLERDDLIYMLENYRNVNINTDSNTKVWLLRYNHNVDISSIYLHQLDKDNLIYLLENYFDNLTDKMLDKIDLNFIIDIKRIFETKIWKFK